MPDSLDRRRWRRLLCVIVTVSIVALFDCAIGLSQAVTDTFSDQVVSNGDSMAPELSALETPVVGSSYFDRRPPCTICCRTCDRSTLERLILGGSSIRLDPANFQYFPRPDCGVRRSWQFRQLPLCKPFWMQTEVNQRSLAPGFYHPAWQFTGDALSDAKNFYSLHSQLKLAGVLAIAGTFANTSIDEDLRVWMHRQKLTAPHVDCWYSELGHGSYLIPGTIAVWGLSNAWIRYRGGNAPVAERARTWGRNATRAYVVGALPLIFWQWATGASRPGESSSGSDWVPFGDTNGASGHAFVGAVPFLTAAKQADRPLVKAALVFGSGLAGYGRLCDDSHYLSQVILGWSIAWLSVEAVHKTDMSSSRYRLVPLDGLGGYGLGIEYRW